MTKGQKWIIFALIGNLFIAGVLWFVLESWWPFISFIGVMVTFIPILLLNQDDEDTTN